MSKTGRSSRYISTRIMLAVALVTGSLAFMAEASLGQAGAPSIAFLNPSGYAKAGERGLIVSDAAPNAGPGCCEGAARGYHLSAWVANAPPGSRVFFSAVQRQVDLEITDTVEAGDTGTWETNWRIPDELMDGPATLRAHLVLDEQQIAVAEQAVTILKVQGAARITYPAAGQEFGMYSPTADALTEGEAATRSPSIGVVDAQYFEDADTDRLRVFYSTSAPGTVPEWKVCGTETMSGAPNGLRCTLVSPEDEGKVTALAAVTNDSATAPAPYEARQNQSGDAVAVGGVYEQTLSTFALTTAGSQSLQRETQAKVFPCSDVETVKLTDQFGRAIAGANVDVHAAGPTDGLKFDHDSLEIWTDVQAPDRGAHSLEAAYDCFTHPGNSDPGEQGEHQRFGAPDRKHAETQAGGTSDLGTLSFALRSTAEGLTEWTAWVDETDDGCAANDDTFTLGELFVSGSIGWGQDATSPLAQPYETLVPCTPAPGPSPSPSEEPEPTDGSRSITLQLEETPTLGEMASFSGRIEAALPACERNQKVLLKMRRPSQKFWIVDRVTTDSNGRFKARAKTKAPRDYRAVTRSTSSCDRAASEPIRLRS